MCCQAQVTLFSCIVTNRTLKPHLIWQVSYAPDGGLEGGRVDVVRHGDDDLDVVGDGPGLELALGLNKAAGIGYLTRGAVTSWLILIGYFYNQNGTDKRPTAVVPIQCNTIQCK